MNILVTGAKGFVGKNLVENLKNIKENKNRTRPEIQIDEIYEYDILSTEKELELYCSKADFVFNLAGVNRPENNEEFMHGNLGFASLLLETLKKYNNFCPVMLASSIQATLKGRFENSEYGRSKKAGEDLFFDYGEATGTKVLVYRFPNLFGKWCRPNYNSAVATFCNAFANDKEFVVNNRATELELVYIDDLVEEMFDAIEGKEHHCEFDGLNVIPNEKGRFCAVPVSHKVSLGQIVDLLAEFAKQPETLLIPELYEGSFAKKLYSTYLSYLPKEKIIVSLNTQGDSRGTFTEIVKTISGGQFSVNVICPNETKGQHWHNSKWEFFVVVSGRGLIQERKLDTAEVLEFEVNGNKLEAVHMLPGFTHNIKNLSDTENLIVLMWANEIFNPNSPDTFRENV